MRGTSESVISKYQVKNIIPYITRQIEKGSYDHSNDVMILNTMPRRSISSRAEVQGGPKFVTPTFRLIARRFVAHSDTYLVTIMLLSTIRGSNSLKYSMCSFRTTPF